MPPAPPDEIPPRPSTFNLKILLLLSFGHLVTDIYQGALPAILPFLKDKLALSYTMAGVLLMAANFTSSIVQPVFGHFSDKKEKSLAPPRGLPGCRAGLSLASLPNSLRRSAPFGGGERPGGRAPITPRAIKPPRFSPANKRPPACRCSRWGGTWAWPWDPLSPWR